MGKEAEKTSSFICYNCKEKNFFDKSEYTRIDEKGTFPEMNSHTSRVIEVTIECKSCRETNNVKIEY